MSTLINSGLKKSLIDFSIENLRLAELKSLAAANGEPLFKLTDEEDERDGFVAALEVVVEVVAEVPLMLSLDRSEFGSSFSSLSSATINRKMVVLF